MLDPHNVLRLLDIEHDRRYPLATDCPLCYHRSKLEIRSERQAHCHSCHFIGDLVELLAAKREQPIEEVVDELRDLALIDCEGASRKRYLRSVEQRQKLVGALKEWSGRLRDNVPGSLRAVLTAANVHTHHTDLQRLAPHVCGFTRRDIEELELDIPDMAKPVLRWWKLYAAIGIPCWYESDITGFWVITVNGCRYLPIGENAAIAGTGFAMVPSFTDEFAVVVDDPIVALRLTFWSQSCNSVPTGFLCTHGVRDNVDDYRCGSTVFWSPSGELRHFIRALKTSDAKVIHHGAFKGDDMRRALPSGGRWEQFRREAINALPVHQSLAYRLLDTTPEEARPELRRAKLDPIDKAKIFSHAAGDDLRHLERLFSDSAPEDTISWNGTAVTDTDDGWIARGRVISAAKLYLDQVRPQGEPKDAMVTGTITYRAPDGIRHSIPFKDKLSLITKNAGSWLQQTVLIETGFHPYVERAWHHRLFEIAQQFHPPTPVMSDQMYGWNGDKLQMPNFTVDRNSLCATRSYVEGPGLPLPAPLAPMEWSAFKSVSFCRVFLAFIGNLVRTFQDRPGVGIMLTNEPHMVSRLAQAFGAEVRVNPTTGDIEYHNRDPLPLFTEWTRVKLTEVFNSIQGYKNIVLSVDNRTAKLSRLQPDWLQLRIGESIDYGALRAVFILLPHVLRASDLEVDSESFYRDLSDQLSEVVEENCSRARLNSAAVTLDTHNVYKESTAATRILELIFYGVERGDIEPDYSKPLEVRICKKEVSAAMANPTIAMPTPTEITSRLEEARFLTRESRRYWYINRMDWDLNASLAGVSQHEV